MRGEKLELLVNKADNLATTVSITLTVIAYEILLVPYLNICLWFYKNRTI